jgi:hypothetical protein
MRPLYGGDCSKEFFLIRKADLRPINSMERRNMSACRADWRLIDIMGRNPKQRRQLSLNDKPKYCLENEERLM